MRTRDEHLEWIKKRALAYLDAGDLENAVASMGSDLEQHPATRMASNHVMLRLGLLYLDQGNPAAVRRWIEGFR
jgi:outer membrane protein assembly factor BamD (BamD/ComL family)